MAIVGAAMALIGCVAPGAARASQAYPYPEVTYPGPQDWVAHYVADAGEKNDLTVTNGIDPLWRTENPVTFVDSGATIRTYGLSTGLSDPAVIVIGCTGSGQKAACTAVNNPVTLAGCTAGLGQVLQCTVPGAFQGIDVALGDGNDKATIRLTTPALIGRSLVLDAGAGDDTIDAGDLVSELINCGDGTDTVRADASDYLVDCENVTRG